MRNQTLIRLLREESGQSTGLMAMFCSVLFLGASAAAIDTGYFYKQRQQVQQVADAAALAAAAGEGSPVSPTTAAENLVAQNGFTVVSSAPTTGQATVSVQDGIAGNGNTRYVQVVITERAPAMILSAMIPVSPSYDVKAIATASYLNTAPTGGPAYPFNDSVSLAQ